MLTTSGCWCYLLLLSACANCHGCMAEVEISACAQCQNYMAEAEFSACAQCQNFMAEAETVFYQQHQMQTLASYHFEKQ